MRRAKSLVAMGEIELMSTTTLRADPPFPPDSPVAPPFAPNSTASTSGVSGTMVKTTSAARATSAGLAQVTAPAAVISAGTLLRVFTCTVWPALTRCRAMGAPMMPRPMNPMFMQFSFG